MALYHFHADIVTRSAGSSVVASAAYRAGEKLHSEYYNEDADYTRKGGVICSEIFLPPNAPAAYADRETLWNAVEKAEKNKKAQLAYTYDFALQNELTMGENIALARRFVEEQFLSKGMIVDFAVHAPDRKDGGIPNPHVHLLCPIRPLKTDGKWGAKQHRVYRLDESGERIIGKDGKPLFDAVPTTDWGQKETLLHWREEWANYVNREFAKKGLPCRVDHRSLEEQGVDRLPTIHEGPNVRAMEARGIQTERGNFNRWVKETNAALQKLRGKIRGLLDWLKRIREAIDDLREPDLRQLLGQYCLNRNAGAYSAKAISNNMERFNNSLRFLEVRKLSTVDDLIAYTSSVHDKLSALNDDRRAKNVRIKELERLLKRTEDYAQYKPLAEQLNVIRFKKRREAFQQEHDRELTFYHIAERELGPHFTKDKKLPIIKWRNELDALRTDAKKVQTDYYELYQESKELLNIRKCIEDAQRQSEQTRNKMRGIGR